MKNLDRFGTRQIIFRQACSPLIRLFFGFVSDIDQTNIIKDIRDGNWLSNLHGSV